MRDMVVGVKMCKDELKMNDNANKMRDRLVELIGQGRTNYFRDDRMTMCESIADILLANGAVVPSCKVGDIVYEVSTLFNETIILSQNPLAASSTALSTISQTK